MDKEKEIYGPIKKFNDHPNCKGHANYMLDCEYTKKSERELIVNCLDNYIQNETNIKKS